MSWKVFFVTDSLTTLPNLNIFCILVACQLNYNEHTFLSEYVCMKNVGLWLSYM